MSHYGKCLTLLSFLLLCGCVAMERKQSEMINDLANVGFNWQVREQGIRPELLPRLTQSWPAGTARAAIVAQLGQPNASVRLAGKRRIDRYYSESLNAWAFVKSGSKPLAVRRAGYLDRELAMVELFYEADRLVHRNLNQEHFSIPGGQNTLQPYARAVESFPRYNSPDFAMYDPVYRRATLWARFTSPRLNQGFAFDQQRARQLGPGREVNELFWTLGLPSRILNSARGEWLVYERARFTTTADQSRLDDFHLKRSSFLVAAGRVQDVEHVEQRWPMPDLQPTWTRGVLTMGKVPASAFFLAGLDSHGWGVQFYRDQQGFDRATPAEYQGMFYHLSDAAFASSLDDIDRFNERHKTGQLDADLYLLRGLALQVRSPERDNLLALIGGDRGTLQRALAGPDSHWLNFQAPDKLYADSAGRIMATLSLSPFYPASPWYGFGPTTQQLGWEYKHRECVGEGECVKALDEIYIDNLTMPWL